MKPYEIKGSVIVDGTVEGGAISSRVSLSFWGGVDAQSGCIIDRRHDLYGECITGKILFMPQGRGSCSSSGILLEMIRINTAPAAIVTIQTEAVLAAGSIIGRELYNKAIPILTVSQEDFQGIQMVIM